MEKQITVERLGTKFKIIKQNGEVDIIVGETGKAIWNAAIEAASNEMLRQIHLTKNNNDETILVYARDAIRKLKK